jgi:hypothetical protein
MDSPQNFMRELLGTSIWESVGVISAVLYLMLATARISGAGSFAFISSACYVLVWARSW